MTPPTGVPTIAPGSAAQNSLFALGIDTRLVNGCPGLVDRLPVGLTLCVWPGSGCRCWSRCPSSAGGEYPRRPCAVVVVGPADQGGATVRGQRDADPGSGGALLAATCELRGFEVPGGARASEEP